MFVFILRKDCVLENILELVDKQMQEVLTIGVILLAKTIFAALVGSSCEKHMIWFP